MSGSYRKLEPFDGKQTNWLGLWWHPEFCGFSSQAFSISDLRKFKGNIRILVRKNKFYNNGENGRPNYLFQLKDSASEIFKPLEVEDEEVEDEEVEDEAGKRFTYDELQSLINQVACDAGGASCYGEYLVTDYIDW